VRTNIINHGSQTLVGATLIQSQQLLTLLLDVSFVYCATT